MTDDTPSDATADRRQKRVLRATLVVAVLLAGISGLAFFESETAPASTGTEGDTLTPAHAGADSVAISRGAHESNDVGGPGDPSEIAPPASVDTTDSGESSSEESPVERHEQELVVTTLILNSLLGVLVFAHRFAPSAIGRFLRPTSHPSEDPDVAEESPEEELRTDRDVVRHLLADSDGQLPQSEIVASTSWSKAKVSRLLDEMESEGEVVKIRLGRQNLVCLDGCEPELSKPMAPPPEDGRSSRHQSDRES